MIILIISIIAAIGTIMFGDIENSRVRSYSPELTLKEKYIKQIEELIAGDKYTKLKEKLANPKYPKEELPWKYWQERIARNIAHLESKASLLDEARDLEAMLKTE